MATTIDSLEIRIQSDSRKAAEGIEELAIALGDLKTNGKISSAVTNLGNLAEALKKLTPVTSNAKKLSDLARSVNELSKVGSFTKTINQLNRLPEALRGLSKLNIDNSLGAKLEGVARAVAPISNIKAGGLPTMINSLRRLDEVTDRLDDGTISRFADRIRSLSNALTPLSRQMTTIQTGLRGVNSTARTAGNGVRHLGERVNVTAFNLSNMIHVAWGVATALRPVVRLLSNAISEAMEWDGISNRFGRGFGERAEEVSSWVKRLNEEMHINTQQFMQYSSTFATMLKGYGVKQEDASEMALGYMELTYDIWAGYNDIYKSLDEAATAVRATISGEVEQIRRAGFTIVNSQLAVTAANHGLKYSTQSATEEMKSYLRYLTLVDQAHSQNLVGTYAREMNTAEGAVRTFSQQLKSLKQVFGSIFLPILIEVMPYLQAFVELLGDAIRAVAAFFGVTVQEIDFGGVADSAGDATDEIEDTTDAIKDLKRATIGIDELNVISPNTGSKGSGSGAGSSDFGGLDVESVWDDSIFAGIQSEVDAIKEKFEEWLPVIETISLALGALGLVKLLDSIGNALSQMGLLEKALATVAIATIEAALVFKFADDYLEDGKLTSLIGEAIAAALGSHLLYRTWGDKGLVLGIAVAIAAQLAAITLNLADGGVEMDDPQLWIQSAFTTALGGVAGGWMAYKGIIQTSIGKGVGLGLLAVASLTLSAITIGEVTANGEATAESIWTGLGSVLAAAGFGFMVGGAYGAAIAAGVSLAINIVGAAIGAISASAEEELTKSIDERFGNVEINASEMRLVVNRLIPDWSATVIEAADLHKGVEVLEKQMDAYVAELEKQEWKVSIGVKLTKEEMDSYQSTIESFVSTTQSWITERGYALEVGLKATGTSDFVVDTSAAITKAASGELESLGKKLQETVNKAYEDGLLDIDEMKAIQTIRNDMMTIVNALKGSEIQAEFDMLEMKWSGVDLTPESYQTLTNEWKTVLDEKVKPALEDTVKETLKTLEGNVAFAKMNLEKKPGNAEAKLMLENAEKALQEYVSRNPLENLTIEAVVESFTFQLNTLQDAFDTEIKRIKDLGLLDYSLLMEDASDAIKQSIIDNGDGDVYGSIDRVVVEMHSRLSAAKESLPKEARAALEEMLGSLEPTAKDLEEIASANRTVGKTVPESVRKGLSDYNQLKALAGDQDGIMYMIGEGFTTDPVFLNTLKTSEIAGNSITGAMREGLLNSMDFVRDDATGVVIGIKDAVTGKTVQMTPTLEKNLRTLGVKMGDGLGSTYEYNYDSTTGVLQSIVDSATGNQLWVNEELKTAGESAGKELSSGLKSGAEQEAKNSKKSWKDWALWPWNWFKEENEINSPSKLFERGGRGIVEGLNNGISPNGIKNPLSTAWNNAKKWWNESKGDLSTYTPSIGNIKSELSSAWDAAKRWWNNNVKLSIPSLSFKVTYTTSGLGAVKTAIVNALKLPGWPKLSFAANGGIFDVGSLIWAGERGAEIVANAGGGRTGVMNVDQMQEAVYEGVYAAVMNAMRATAGDGGKTSVNVYLDSRQLTSSVERRQHERGASIMGNQVYAY